MHTCAEQLPIEIWLTIFQYLEAHSLFQAFQNLNHYFDQILASNHLLFYIRLKETDNNHLQYSTNPYWSDSVLSRVVCLRSGVQFRSNHLLEFLRWHAKKLIRLQSLSIQIHSRATTSISYIYHALKELDRLEYLSLTCTPSQSLFESIFSIPTLRICQLILRESTTINNPLNVNSQIKQLFLVFPGSINYSLVNLLLICTPKLKRFGISGSSFSFDQISIFDKQLFTLPELRILKLRLEGGYSRSDWFKCLHTIMPVLKHFYFHYNRHVLDEAFLDNFISYWWPIIEPIRYIDVYIKGHIIIMDTDDNNTWVDLQKKRQFLLDKSNQSNGSFKVEWTQKDFLRLRFTEITIVKS